MRAIMIEQKKRSVWINICRVFFPSFDDKEDKEKNDQ